MVGKLTMIFDDLQLYFLVNNAHTYVYDTNVDFWFQCWEIAKGYGPLLPGACN